jgi:WD40 repeat protein
MAATCTASVPLAIVAVLIGWGEAATAQESKLRATLTGSAGEVRFVAFSPDGKLLASVSESETLPHAGEIMLWDVATGKGSPLLQRPKETDWLLAFGRGGNFATAGPDGIRLWDLGTRKQKRTFKEPKASCLAFSPDGRVLAVGGMKETYFDKKDKEPVLRTDQIKLYDAGTGKEAATLELGMLGGTAAMAFSPDGKTLAAATLSFSPTIILWDVNTGKPKKAVRDKKVLVSLAFSPDGKMLATGDEEGDIKLWDAATGKATTRLAGHAGWVNSVQFSPDGKTLASASHDGTIRLWNAAGEKEITVLRSHTGKVRSIAFSPDGRTLASGGSDKLIKLWTIPQDAGTDR